MQGRSDDEECDLIETEETEESPLTRPTRQSATMSQRILSFSEHLGAVYWSPARMLGAILMTLATIGLVVVGALLGDVFIRDRNKGSGLSAQSWTNYDIIVLAMLGLGILVPGLFCLLCTRWCCGPARPLREVKTKENIVSHFVIASDDEQDHPAHAMFVTDAPSSGYQAGPLAAAAQRTDQSVILADLPVPNICARNCTPGMFGRAAGASAGSASLFLLMFLAGLVWWNDRNNNGQVITLPQAMGAFLLVGCAALVCCFGFGGIERAIRGPVWRPMNNDDDKDKKPSDSPVSTV